MVADLRQGRKHENQLQVAVTQFSKFLVNKPLTAATKEDVRAFIFSLYGRGLAATTMQARRDALQTLFDCLQLGGQVRESVPRYILRRKLPTRLPHAKSEEEIERLIAATRNSRDRAIIELGYASGLRVSELRSLNVEDVNLEARSLFVRRGKGDKDRLGLFGHKAAAALKDYLGDRKRGPLFLAQRYIQQGGVSKDRYGTWRGWWRERSGDGKLKMRSVRLGDYDLPTKERAREALRHFLDCEQIARAERSPQRMVIRSI